MRQLLLSVSIAAALGAPLAACNRAPAPETAAAPAVAEKIVDEHSFSQPDKVRTTDLALDLVLDFDRKTISGTAT